MKSSLMTENLFPVGRKLATPKIGNSGISIICIIGKYQYRYIGISILIGIGSIFN
jgi:hypothetical protein